MFSSRKDISASASIIRREAPRHMGRETHLREAQDPSTIQLTARLLLLAATALALMVAAAAPAPVAAAESSLPRQLGAALAVPHVNQSRSAAVAVDLTTDTLVFARNTRLPLAPASTEKLAVAYAALVVLGPVYQIPTEVLGSGGLSGTTWRGDVVLKGWGDPTLGTADLRALANQLRLLGIRRITGGVVGD